MMAPDGRARNGDGARWAFAGVALASVLVSSPAFAEDEDACVASSERAYSALHRQSLLEARAALVACTAAGCPDIVRTSCRRRLAEIDAAIPAVVFDVKDAAGSAVSGVQISVDGSPITGHAAGAPLSLDPGTHQLRFQAAGFRPLERSLDLRQGEHDRREAVVLEAVPTEQPAPVSTGWSSVRIAGVAVAAVGVAGIAVGAVFGVKASSDRSSELAACGSVCASVADQNAAASDRSAFFSDGAISTVAFVAGGALVATGAVLFFAGKPSADARASTGWQLVPTVGRAGAGALVSRAF
jgi:hypothetical protein